MTSRSQGVCNTLLREAHKLISYSERMCVKSKRKFLQKDKLVILIYKLDKEACKGSFFFKLLFCSKVFLEKCSR